LKTPRIALDFEGVEHSNITHLARVDLALEGHRSISYFLVTPLRSNSRIILGMPWFCQHGASIQASQDRSITLTFSSPRCLQYCCSTPVTIQALSERDIAKLEPYRLEPAESKLRNVSPSTTRYRQQRKLNRHSSNASDDPGKEGKSPKPILEVSAVVFHYLAQQPDVETFSLSLRDIDRALQLDSKARGAENDRNQRNVRDYGAENGRNLTTSF
jgi:hypothetical protein